MLGDSILDASYVARDAAKTQETVRPTEAHRRLEALKQVIADELLTERRLKEIERNKPKLDPLSLAPTNEAKRQRQSTQLDGAFHNLIQSLKLDTWVQKELEGELDRKTQEMEALQLQNDRLREIITLRQEANQRREHALQAELDRLRGITRRAAPPDLTAAMDELREMKELINAGADTLYDTLKQRAVSERLALVRTFTVRIREVQQLIERQREDNTRGAQEWIDRYAQLEGEHDETAAEALYLTSEVGTLRVAVNDFESTTNENRNQFDSLIDELASLKADNMRLNEHCGRLRNQIGDLYRKEEQRAASGSPPSQRNNYTATSSQPSSSSNPPSRPGSSMALGQQRLSVTPGGGGADSGVRSGSVQAHLQQQSSVTRRAAGIAAAGAHDRHSFQQRPPRSHGAAGTPAAGAAPHQASHEERAAIAVRRLKGTLVDMRGRIKQVRAAHIEHLQERTELELFLRQCVDDVRRDLDRASSSDFHQRFSDQEKQRVVDILAAKLRVLTALHRRTFPNKLSPVADYNFPVDVVMYAETDAVQGISREHGKDKKVDAVTGGSMASDRAVQSLATAIPFHGSGRAQQHVATRPPRAAAAPAAVGVVDEQQQEEEIMDSLWSKWQDWNARISASPQKEGTSTMKRSTKKPKK